MSRENTNSMGPMLLTALAGAAVGAVVVALTTPKTGPEFRGDLKRYARRAKGRAGELIEDTGLAWDGMVERRVLVPSDRRRNGSSEGNGWRG